mmetsp:Transcript_131746/g.185875  ORF Transcript_131746/g.185875 Transcript_131746/m.185875 type:complete len:80 (+) Transcript_131746:112-351(+)
MMIWKFFLCFLISVSAISQGGPKASSAVQGQSKLKTKTMTQHQCKVQCQRFGMKGMGDEFKDIATPQKCVAKCEQIYKS